MRRLPGLKDLETLLSVAARVDAGVGACVQVTDDTTRTLRLFAHHGLTADYYARYPVMEYGASTACGQAVAERRRVVIRDVHQDLGFADHAEIAAEAGYRALQSTPLFTRSGAVLGVLSTYYPTPHHPDARSLGELDFAARAIALVVEIIHIREALAGTGLEADLSTLALGGDAYEAGIGIGKYFDELAHTRSLQLAESFLRNLATIADALSRSLAQLRLATS